MNLKTGQILVMNSEYGAGALQPGDTVTVLKDYTNITKDTLIKVKNGGVHYTMYAWRTDMAIKETPADILPQVARVSALFGKRRPLTPVMLQLQEELGELSTEVAIATGTKNRTPSEDGIAGEAVDVAIVALDIALLETGGDIEAIKAIFERKLAKWESYK